MNNIAKTLIEIANEYQKIALSEQLESLEAEIDAIEKEGRNIGKLNKNTFNKAVSGEPNSIRKVCDYINNK